MCKRFLIVAIFVWFAFGFVVAGTAPKQHIYTVVIDAGHGGKDAGAVGRISMEKDLNLTVSLLAGKKIQMMYPDIQVVFTRTTDLFLPLQRRADIVNANNADLFICIHTNSAENKTSVGTETFVLGTEKMGQNLDVAMRENAVMKLEADYQTTYQGFDPNSIDSYIMFELMQNRYMDQSLQFASYVQQNFTNQLHRVDRGVRQAAFWVLLKSACPSVLVEMGFISNPEEEKFLNSTQGQEQIAGAIAEAFKSFYRKSSVPDAPVLEPTEPAQKTKIEKKEKTETPRFAVQIAAVKQRLAANDPALKGLTEFKFYETNGLYKYYTAESVTREEAKVKQKQLNTDFPGCFVIKLPE